MIKSLVLEGKKMKDPEAPPWSEVSLYKGRDSKDWLWRTSNSQSSTSLAVLVAKYQLRLGKALS